MKKIIIYSLLFSAIAILVISCQKEELNLHDQQLNAQLDKETVPGPSALPAIPVPPVQIFAPDLRFIGQLTTNVTATTTRCGSLMPNVSCIGGQRSFFITGRIFNVGTAPLPPGVLEVRWTNTNPAGTFNFTQQFPHGGIAPGAFLVVGRPYWMGPCGCPPPPVYFAHTFTAEADPNNLIAEISETNNVSIPRNLCDGC